ncbi:MAG: hypothetical protein WAW60_02020 [Candidatus Saccharimonadales bacterium]
MIDNENVSDGSAIDTDEVEVLRERASARLNRLIDGLFVLCEPKSEYDVRVELQRKLFLDAVAQSDPASEHPKDKKLAAERFWFMVCSESDPDAGIDIELARYLCALSDVVYKDNPEDMEFIPADIAGPYHEGRPIVRTDINPLNGEFYTTKFRSLADVIEEFRDMVERYDTYMVNSILQSFVHSQMSSKNLGIW